jgi:formate-dependent phosphoribosylglycinamide formyltransferase (GAR transformylase)
MSKKALLVGSSFSAAPIFFSLKKRGFHVSVCGNLKTDPCHQYADNSFYIDYSDPDELLRLVETEKFDCLVPTCNDYSYMSCAVIAQKFGFPGFDPLNIANILHTKNEFRAWTEKLMLPAPRSSRQKGKEPVQVEQLRFPLLVKPVDSFSGRGVIKVASESGLPLAIKTALESSRSNEVVLEEFVQGSLHSHSAFISGQEVALDFFVDEYCTVYPYQVNCSNHPSFLPESLKNAVRDSITLLAKTLGIADGLLHTQFIADGDRFWIIECMRRCPGDLYSGLIELSTSIGYVDLFVRPFLGEDMPLDVALKKPKCFGRHTISTNKPIVNYTFSHNIPESKVRIVPLKNSGERLDIAPFDKLAILFTEYATQSAMRDITPKLADFIMIQSLEETYLEPKNPLSGA